MYNDKDLDIVNVLRMYADDLHSDGGFNGYARAMSLAADEIVKLREHHAALAQPEPEPVAYTDDVTRIMREAGMTFHLGLPHKAVIEQMTRVVDLVCAEASIKAAQKFAVALAQPDWG